MSEIVPFGKYKGKPVEILAEDRQYAEWLANQDWFRDKYQNIYTLIVNNFGEPACTPEHNALQAVFLDGDFCLSFIEHVFAGWLDHMQAGKSLILENDELYRLRRYYEKTEKNLERAASIKADLDKYRSKISIERKGKVEFEVKGVDVVLTCQFRAEKKEDGSSLDFDAYFPSGSAEAKFLIEVKPVVADDYPAVLRQMKASGAQYLFLDHYTGVGATREQFVKIFSASGVIVVFRDEVKPWKAEVSA